uniref:Methyltransferase n=1 Tax=uncultured bacterium contig00004 TaxID=1181496 RepID=A0A806KEW9_9BACT|nr:DNA modification methyltransferase [uncultured bacterium contig00004]
MKKLLTDKVNLIFGDAISGMKDLPDNTFDLAVCDPPYGAASEKKWSYNSDNKITGFGGSWKLNNECWDLLSKDDNFCSTYAWLAELKRLVKPTGSIWIHATYHNSGFVNTCCQLLNIEIINEIIWYKRNAFPNLSARRLTASHETILWVHTGESNREYYFNYDEVKKATFPEDNLKEKDKQLRTVWDIPNNKTKNEIQFGTHPTQKPLRLIDRIMLISAKKGGKLLIPFSGSGTEVISGLKYDMEITAFENNKEYYDLSIKRINRHIKDAKELLIEC